MRACGGRRAQTTYISVEADEPGADSSRPQGRKPAQDPGILDMLTEETLGDFPGAGPRALCVRRVCMAVSWPEEWTAHQECFPSPVLIKSEPAHQCTFHSLLCSWAYQRM